MGISINSHAGDLIPRRLIVWLKCDKPGCRHAQSVMSSGYITSIGALKRNGWTESTKSGKRLFICPACNGKVPTADLFA
jgi:hypothetical protein